MTEKSFFDLCVRQGYDPVIFYKFKSALSFAKKNLLHKKRLSGDTVFDHNVRVAIILAESKSSPEIVLAGILQGSLQSCSEEEIQKEFGEEVFRLIQGVEEIKKIKSKNIRLEADALRTVLLTTLRDVRVIFIKLANKLDNLRCIGVLPKDEQKKIAEEVLEVYAPLAYSLGFEKIKNSLEDISLQILKPQKYQEIINFLEESREERELLIVRAVALLKEIAAGKISILKIKGRPKQIYSIYKKIVQRKVPLDEQYDLLGIRVIVPEVKDCYTLLGLLHENFEPVAGKLKDYIANPKPNFYRSIHTCIQLPSGKEIEVQIRTPEMDEFAEEGFAAHWRYKQLKVDPLQKQVSWLKEILELKKESGNKEFLEMAKVDVFGDKIYCYTPKGSVKELPQGATLLDFAYLIHEEVGNHAVGGNVNGKFMPLKHQLMLGDVVEIITNKSQRPRREWIKIVKSGKVRQKIRRILKEHELLPAFHFKKFKPLIKEEQGILVEAPEFPAAICVLARCCNALPGDSIIGIATKRRVISVHDCGCRAALKEESRWISVKWKESFNQKIKFYVLASERSGLLADVLNTIATAQFEVKEAKAKLIGAGNVECSFLVIPKDLEHLISLMTRVKKVKGVKKIYFE